MIMMGAFGETKESKLRRKQWKENEEFKTMYQKHRELNKKVDKAGAGELPLSDDAAHDMKKEKLFLKDEMAELIESYKQQLRRPN